MSSDGLHPDQLGLEFGHNFKSLLDGIHRGVRQVFDCEQKLRELIPEDDSQSPRSPGRKLSFSRALLKASRESAGDSTRHSASMGIKKQVSFTEERSVRSDLETDADLHALLEGKGSPQLPLNSRNSSRRSSVHSDPVLTKSLMMSGIMSKAVSHGFQAKDVWAIEDPGEEDDMFETFLEDTAERYAKKPDHGESNAGLDSFDDPEDAKPTRVACWRRSRMIHPQSRKRLVWDSLSVGMIGFDVVMLPMIYGMGISETVEVLAVEWFTTIFWSTDMFMSFLTGYTVGPEVIMSPRKVACNYLSTWFTIDFIIVGCEWASRITEFIQGFNAFRAARAVRVLRVVRVVRLIRLARFVKTLHKLMEMTGSVRLLIIFNVLKMACLLILAVHFFSVGWHFVGYNTPGGWVDKEGFLDEPAMVRYVAAARWTLAQLNGRTDRQERTFVEMLYIAFTACFTLIFMSIFVSSLTSRMLQLQQLMDKESGYKRLLQRYREMHSLSFTTVYLAKRHIKDRTNLDSDMDTEAQLLRLLPVQTQADLLSEVRMPLLSHHPFFRIMKGEFTATLRALLIHAVKQESSRYMETVFAKGGACHQMYFVDGQRLLYSKDTGLKSWLAEGGLHFEKQRKSSPARRVQNMLRGKRQFIETQNEMLQNYELQVGTYLCEASLWAEKWVNQGDFISTAHSKLVTIHSASFAEVVAKHEDSLQLVSFYARKYMEALRANFETGECDGDIFHVDLHAVLGVEPPAEIARGTSSSSLTRNRWPRASFASVLRAGAPFLRGGTSSSSQLSSGHSNVPSMPSPASERRSRGQYGDEPGGRFQDSFYKLNTIPSMADKEMDEAVDQDDSKLSL